MAVRRCDFYVWVLASAAFAVATAVVPAPCMAQIDISKADDAATINLVANHASFDEILDKLGEHFAFNVERASDAKSNTTAVNVTLSGTLDSVLKRLLRNRNYLIVRRPDNIDAIEKIVLLTATEGAPPSSAPVVLIKPSAAPSNTSQGLSPATK